MDLYDRDYGDWDPSNPVKDSEALPRWYVWLTAGFLVGLVIYCLGVWD